MFKNFPTTPHCANIKINWYLPLQCPGRSLTDNILFMAHVTLSQSLVSAVTCLHVWQVTAEAKACEALAGDRDLELLQL